MTNWRNFPSFFTRFKATKLGGLVASGTDPLLPNQMTFWSHGQIRSFKTLKIYLHVYKTYDHQSLYRFDLLWDALYHKLKKHFDHLITWGHVANQKTYASISILSFLIIMKRNRICALLTLSAYYFSCYCSLMAYVKHVAFDSVIWY